MSNRVKEYHTVCLIRNDASKIQTILKINKINIQFLSKAFLSPIKGNTGCCRNSNTPEDDNEAFQFDGH